MAREKTIFLSSSLPEDTDTHSLLDSYGFQIIAFSLIELVPIKQPPPPPMDWVFFYSKNALKFFIELFGVEKLGAYKIGLLGPSALPLLKNIELQAHYVGNGAPQSSVKAFTHILGESKVLIPTATHSMRRLPLELKKPDQYTEIDLYQNQIKSKVLIPEADVYLFTSPLNVESYLFNGGKITQPAIAIGPSTLKALEENNFNQSILCEKPSKDQLIMAGIKYLFKK